MPKLVNSKILNGSVLNNPQVQKQARLLAERKLAEQKLELINNFISHPVSKEIAGGSGVSNSSGTLGGYGNLFSFIGFNGGENPVEDWVNFLEKKIKILGKKRNIQSGKNNFIFQFEVVGIADNDYVSNARMPWESGRSWILSIERGISGFSNFIAKKMGRSGGGIQATNNIRNVQYKSTAYWSPLWTKFIKNLKEV